MAGHSRPKRGADCIHARNDACGDICSKSQAANATKSFSHPIETVLKHEAAKALPPHAASCPLNATQIAGACELVQFCCDSRGIGSPAIALHILLFSRWRLR